MPYPDPKELKQRLDEGWISPVTFHDVAMRVCEEAEKHDPAMTDVQTIAQLLFIERVLNG